MSDKDVCPQVSAADLEVCFRDDGESWLEAIIRNAYAFYDSDARVSGPDDFEAFSDALRRALSGETFEESHEGR